MVVTLEELKMYTRVDSNDEDALLLTLLATAESLCEDILRSSFTDMEEISEPIQTAVLYGVSYLYDNREGADFKELTMTLRCLLFGQKNVWMDYYFCHAYVNNLSGREYWEAAQVNQEASLYFIVRYCSELRMMDSTLYRIVFQREIYNITFVDFMQYQNKTIKLRGEKVRR